MASFVYDSSGALTMDWPFPRYDTLDEIDEACGDKLESLEGGRVEDIFVVWNDTDGLTRGWSFDFFVILRLDGADVVVDVLSGAYGGIAFERIDIDAPVTVFGCDISGAHEEHGHLDDLSWRSYVPLAHLKGLTVEQFYWRADSRTHPIALGCRLEGGAHLRIGGTADITEPSQVDPFAPDGDAIYDGIILPLKYHRPVKETPVITEVWEPENIPYRIITLDRSWMEHGCKRDALRHCIFVGGLTLPCAIEHTRPPAWRGVGIQASREEVPTDFLVGRMAEIV